jgi:hypothetical protein
MDEKIEKSKSLNRMLQLVKSTEDFYRKEYADQDTRHLSYYRGKFWRGDGVLGVRETTRNYAATQNEIFPVLDSLVSSLAQDVPQVECVDLRVRRVATPTRVDDPTFAGRGIATVLNMWSEEEEYDVVIHELVLQSALFRYGVCKTIWEPSLNRATTSTRLPWEVHFDPSAKRVKDANWVFERFTMHIDEVQARIKEKVYDKPSKEIKPAAFPRSVVDEAKEDAHYRQMRESGLDEWVSLIEFWDLRNGMMYHIDVDNRQVLLETTIPWGNPYTVLVFHDGVGRIDGVSDVSLLADNQRDINELVSARREIVRRLPRRMLVARDLFDDDTEWERWKNAKTWEPVRVTVPPGRVLGDNIYVTPEMPTTIDFNAMLGQSGDSLRRTAGLADFQRGSVKNIRTAAEAHMIQGGADGRVNVRMKNVVRAVKAIFKVSLACWRWAVKNPQSSKIDMEDICDLTQADVASDVLAREVLEMSPRFNLLPFTPLMDDKNVRREKMVMLLQTLTASGIAPYMDLRELARELVEEFRFRPSVVKSAKAIEQEAQAQMMMAAQTPPEGMG